ncbi:NAD(P)-dependent oxidoreductase [Akkermansiaceae bacterium]|nr:NAD(P)-dependent oxidoreductase [Akkermansiaceae bacterium]
MKFFVTGGTGFIGSNFINRAISAGHQVKAIKRRGSYPPIKVSNQVEWIEGSFQQVIPLIGECTSDCLIHFAAYGVYDTDNWEQCFQVNLNDSFSLLRSAIDAGTSSIVLIGTCFEYGKSGERYDYIPENAPLEPTCAYGASKAAMSLCMSAFAMRQNIRLQILRPFHTFGPGERKTRFFQSLKNAAKNGYDFPMTSGEQVRDFCSVSSVADQILEAASHKDIPQGIPLAHNLGTGRPQSLREFAEYWWEKWGATGDLQCGALPQRQNEVMRYVPLIKPS